MRKRTKKQRASLQRQRASGERQKRLNELRKTKEKLIPDAILRALQDQLLPNDKDSYTARLRELLGT